MPPDGPHPLEYRRVHIVELLRSAVASRGGRPLMLADITSRSELASYLAAVSKRVQPRIFGVRWIPSCAQKPINPPFGAEVPRLVLLALFGFVTVTAVKHSACRQPAYRTTSHNRSAKEQTRSAACAGASSARGAHSRAR